MVNLGNSIWNISSYDGNAEIQTTILVLVSQTSRERFVVRWNATDCDTSQMCDQTSQKQNGYMSIEPIRVFSWSLNNARIDIYTTWYEWRKESVKLLTNKLAHGWLVDWINGTLDLSAWITATQTYTRTQHVKPHPFGRKRFNSPGTRPLLLFFKTSEPPHSYRVRHGTSNVVAFAHAAPELHRFAPIQNTPW